MNFARFFVDRPIFAAVLSIIIFVVGLIAIPLLPVSEYPEVVPPSVLVRATYPGANPKVIAETVAAPLEQVPHQIEHPLPFRKDKDLGIRTRQHLAEGGGGHLAPGQRNRRRVDGHSRRGHQVVLRQHTGVGGKDCVVAAPIGAFEDFSDLVRRSGFLRE